MTTNPEEIKNKSADQMVDMIANLTAVVARLDARLSKLESTSSVEGIYLDGSPSYVRDYVLVDKKEEYSPWKTETK